MRPKFRAKDKDGEWVYGMPGTLEGWLQGNTDLSPLSWFFTLLENGTLDISTLGMFTGLHDREGKEIWEGDILEMSPEAVKLYGASISRTVVAWGEREATFMVGRNYYRDPDTYLWLIASHSTVIGNVYENKELLEVPDGEER